MEEKNVIEVQGLKKIYRIGNEKVRALDGVDLTVKKGEICCLLGVSGSGKSTLLNMLAGLEKPSKGEIKILGKNIRKFSEAMLSKFRMEHFGFVFQSYNLLAPLTAIENVTLPLIFKGIPNKARQKKANSILKAVGLGDRMKHKPTQMSGGQQQRVGIARAFIDYPDIVFADEPTGNLDTKTTNEVMDMMVRMTKERNNTLIIVTHNNEIAEYADHVIHLRDGVVINEYYKEEVQ